MHGRANCLKIIMVIASGSGVKMLFERYWPTTTLTTEANFDKRSDIQPELHENGMLKGCHFDRNSNQYTNSVKEALRTTMLNQEATFRNQVNELHRLYKVQQNLMNELNRKEFENFTAWIEIPKPVPLTYLKAMQYRQSTEENNFPTSCSSMSAKEVSRGSESFYSKLQKLQRRSFDLHLPADEYINTEVVKGANPQTSINGCLETKDFLNRKVNEPKDLKLAFCSGKETANKGGFGKMLSNRDIPIIDLEESTERLAGEVKAVSSTNCEAASTRTGTQHEHDSQVSVMSELNYSERTRKDVDHEPFLKHSSADDSGIRQELKSFDLNAGWNEDEDGSVSDPFAQEQSTSPGAIETHHNLAQVNGSDWRTATNGCSDVTHSSLQDNAAYSTSTNSTDKSPALLSHPSQLSGCGNTQVSHQSTKTGNTWIHDLNEVGPIDVELVPEGPSKRHSNSRRECSCDNGSSSLPPTGSCKTTDETANMSQGQPTGFHQDNDRRDALGKVEERFLHFSVQSTDLLHTIGNADSRQVNSEKSEEDTLSSRQAGCHVAVWVSESSANDEKTSTIDEKTMGTTCSPRNAKDLESVSENQQKERFPNLSAHEDSGTTQLESDITGASSNKENAFMESGVDACLSGKSYELKIQEHNEHQQQPEQAELDFAMQRAAESLIHISLVKTSSSDCPSSTRQEEPETVERHDEPQYSSDSYESITLMLTESCMDEYSTTAKPFEERDLGDNASGLNLRRGRRMKDFQRDILPSLVSLSRHEICEDMNIIGGVIRANEYMKNGCRRVRAETWCLPTRGRRAKLYCSNRRY